MANRIVVDPITRIEGHLRIEVDQSDFLHLRIFQNLADGQPISPAQH